jgi:hypothetical protein
LTFLILPIANVFSGKDPERLVENTMEFLMTLMILNEIPNFFDMLFEVYMISIDPEISEHPTFMKIPVKYESFKIAFKFYAT